MPYAICPNCASPFNRDEPWKKVCIKCYIQAKRKEESGRRDPPPRREPPPRTSGVDKELLKRLIILCHPDKHNGSKMSVEVTQKLLQMKQ